MPTKSKKSAKVVVNRKFMLDFANSIYNPKTRKFLRLCDGTLQNGPDPEDEERPMHCGLGELYFAMTGHQPKEDSVSENGVVDKAVELSELEEFEEVARKKAEAAEKATRAKVLACIKKSGAPKELMEQLECDVHNWEDDHDEEGETEEDFFRAALDEIPNENDDGEGDACGEGTCSAKTYQKRAARVANQLREAAKYLPT